MRTLDEWKYQLEHYGITKEKVKDILNNWEEDAKESYDKGYQDGYQDAIISEYDSI